MLSTPEQMLSNTGTAAHIGRAVCSVVPEYTPCPDETETGVQ